MNRLAWIAVVALVGLLAFAVGKLLDSDSVPVAGAVELIGTAPTDRPLPEGFFIVPPRVVDFRGDPDGGDDSSGPPSPSDAGDGTGVRPSEDDDGVADADDDGEADAEPDVSPDDSPDDRDDDPDDSVDDDD